MSRPKPTVLLEHVNKTNFKSDQVLSSEGIWASVYIFVRHGHARDFGEGVGQLFYAYPTACAQVDRNALLFGFQIVKRCQVALRQVHHMDVVAHASAVGRGVVFAKDT